MQHTRRILLAFSFAASAASVAFADYQNITQTTAEPDRLEQLSKTLAQGSYIQPNDIDIDLPESAYVNIQAGKKAIEINNQTLSAKAKKSSQRVNESFGSKRAYSWLVTHPLPDAVRVSSEYGGRTMGGRVEHHSGLDLSAPSGTPIYATGSGIVTKSGWGSGYGQYVEINHGNGYLTRYAHASRLMVRVGDTVQAGEHIANVGCTGRCTGPHLHYEIVKDGQRKNPSTYLAMLP